MATSHRKIKSVAKMMVPSGDRLDGLILDTMKTIADLVGSTLGPGGKVVAIERQEFGVPDLVTKDGVTVFRALGFDDPVAHSIMTLARDASVRTATEAGDGTTTATVLSEAFVRKVHEFCKKNPTISPQRVVRTMELMFRTEIEPFIRSLAMPIDEKLLRSVATCSTNGDLELTDSVAECFRITGDEGNVTLTEQSGPSGYRVEKLEGYGANVGYEDCVRQFFPIFINDQANNRVVVEKPVFVLYNGTLTELSTIVPILQKIGARWGGADKNNASRNIIVVANAFSDQCLGDMAANWPDLNSVNIYPLVAPRNPMQSGQLDFIVDLAAITGSVIFDPITYKPSQGTLDDIGPELEYFEATRYRSNIVGYADEGLVQARIEEIEAQLPKAESIVETNILNERKGKLSGGIAKLIISAPTSGELREKRDRAEDAVCAWRGAAKQGALPGGGWTLLKVLQHLDTKIEDLTFERLIFEDIFVPALREPVERLLRNCGYTEAEIVDRVVEMKALLDEPDPVVFDALFAKFKFAKDSGVVDSLPAVLEAVRNSISIASQLGTLGGVIVFPRDPVLERQEASSAYEYYKDSGMTK